MNDGATLYDQRRTKLYLHYKALCEASVVRYIDTRSYLRRKLTMLRSKAKPLPSEELDFCFDSQYIERRSYLMKVGFTDAYYRDIEKLEQTVCRELAMIERNYLDDIKKLPWPRSGSLEKAVQNVHLEDQETEEMEDIEEWEDTEEDEEMEETEETEEPKGMSVKVLHPHCSIAQRVSIQCWLQEVEHLNMPYDDP